jgi:hypothetical protein
VLPYNSLGFVATVKCHRLQSMRANLMVYMDHQIGYIPTATKLVLSAYESAAGLRRDWWHQSTITQSGYAGVADKN